MNKVYPATVVALLGLFSTAVYAGPAVPEIDGAHATLALALTAGVVALVQEYYRKN